MAFNWQTFQTRTLTAIVFVVVMLVGLLWNKWSFFLLFSIIHFGCWWEYLQLMDRIYDRKFHINAKLGLMLMGYGLVLWLCGPLYHINGYGVSQNLSLPVSSAGFILLIAGIFQTNKINARSFGAAMLGIIYISLSWGLLIHLRSSIAFPSFEPMWWASKELGLDPLAFLDSRLFMFKSLMLCIAVIATMWINDTMAYIVGSIIGKTPLSPISPKKTWEGTIGGIVLASVIVGVGLHIVNTTHIQDASLFPLSLIQWVMLALIAAITGTFGDLLESKLKRMAGVKDSGRIMPGHGGFLDRFDSLLLATPFVWMYLRILL